jgi:hypothetical protein
MSLESALYVTYHIYATYQDESGTTAETQTEARLDSGKAGA